MLEALVSLRRGGGNGAVGGGEKSGKKCGDIIVVKKSPAVWGEMEKRLFLIAKLRDDELEARVGEVLVHPYAEVETTTVMRHGKATKIRTMKSRSRVRVDLSMFEGSPGLDPRVSVGAVSPNGKEYLETKDLKK